MKSVLHETRERQRKRKTKRRYIYATLVFLGGISLTGVLFIPQIMIRTVDVSGFHTVKKDDIEHVVYDALSQRAWFVYPRSNFFLVPTEAIQASILSLYPRITSVDIVKSFPRRMSITIHERATVAVWCEESNSMQGEDLSMASDVDTAVPETCWYIDEHGIVFEPAPAVSGSLIPVFTSSVRHFTAGDAALSSDAVAQLLAFRERLMELFHITVTRIGIDVEYKGDIHVETNEGWFVRVEHDTDMREALANIQLILEKKIPDRADLAYIDARFHGKVFYKLRSREQADPE